LLFSGQVKQGLAGCVPDVSRVSRERGRTQVWCTDKREAWERPLHQQKLAALAFAPQLA